MFLPSGYSIPRLGGALWIFLTAVGLKNKGYDPIPDGGKTIPYNATKWRTDRITW